MDNFNIAAAIVSFIASGVAIYQFAINRERQKRNAELQYLLAGVHQAALSNQLAWDKQLNLLNEVNPSTAPLELKMVMSRARDDLTGIAALASTLEKAIDSQNSALGKMKEEITTDVKQAKT